MSSVRTCSRTVFAPAGVVPPPASDMPMATAPTTATVPTAEKMVRRKCAPSIRPKFACRKVLIDAPSGSRRRAGRAPAGGTVRVARPAGGRAASVASRARSRAPPGGSARRPGTRGLHFQEAADGEAGAGGAQQKPEADEDQRVPDEGKRLRVARVVDVAEDRGECGLLAPA